jgi:hypothetical protein
VGGGWRGAKWEDKEAQQAKRQQREAEAGGTDGQYGSSSTRLVTQYCCSSKRWAETDVGCLEVEVLQRVDRQRAVYILKAVSYSATP